MEKEQAGRNNVTNSALWELRSEIDLSSWVLVELYVGPSPLSMLETAENATGDGVSSESHHRMADAFDD